MIKFKTSILASALGLAIVTSPLYAFEGATDVVKTTVAKKATTKKAVKKDPLVKMRKEMSELSTRYSYAMQKQKNANLKRRLLMQRRN